MQVVADTSLFNYLILIDQIALLPALYGRIVIPPAVLYEELLHFDSPPRVRAWAASLPAWLDVRQVAGAPDVDLQHLERGEQEAIALAQELQADLLLMDDKDGRQAAEQHSLTVFGTLGVLERGAEQGLVDLPEVLTRLLATNFYASARIIQELLARDAARKAYPAQRAAEAAGSSDAGQAPERSP
jgi:predicted nucleic acid-binding protein